MLTIEKAVVVQTPGSADTVMLYTANPTPTPKLTSEPLCLTFKAPPNEGLDYVVLGVAHDKITCRGGDD